MSSKWKEENDSVVQGIVYAIANLLVIEGYETLIPQVGANLVYADPNATKTEDVAALTGRMIKTIYGPMSCGEVVYGASKYLSSVVLEALKIDNGIRAALNIRAHMELTEKLRKIGLRVEILPQKTAADECPVSQFIKEGGYLVDVYVHMGDFGIEPTTTIISESPEELVGIIRKLLEYE
jgi:predicted fused transcriptional regulator/phosphomethylpyrimidine kinase